MKKFILTAAIFAFSTALFAQKKPNDVAKFATETIDQGKLEINKPKEVKFIVTNISSEPLLIEQANPTCGCTMGDYTKSPIAPGATGYVTAKFNAATLGHFDKHLTVKFAGVDETKSITITGDVLSAEEYAKLGTSDTKTATVATTATSTTATPIKAKTKTTKAKTKKAATISTAKS